MQPYYEQDGIQIWHADCRDVLPSLRNGSVHLLVTDPPYNVSEFNGRDNTTVGKIKRADGSYREIRKDFGGWDREFSPEVLLEHASRLLIDNGGFLAFSSDVLLPDYLRTPHLRHRKLCVWFKTNAQPVFRGVGYQQSTEFIEWRTNGDKATFFGGGAEPNVFQGPKEHAQVHPTQKPEWLMAKLIQLHSEAGNTVLDPFMGSGTTLVAAKRLGRLAIGIEREEKYCEIAAKRLAQGALPMEFSA